MAVFYCSLCRRTSFTGRRHLYSAAHRRRLQEALGRLEEEVAAARAAMEGAAVRLYDPAEHERRVWCLCCGRGVRRDGRSGALALPHAGLLQHLAGAEHRRETARFWRENRAEAALRDRFVVAEEEYARFAAALERAVGEHEEREQESIRQMAARIREAERRQRDTVRAALEVGAAELSPSNGTRALCGTFRLQLRCGIRPGHLSLCRAAWLKRDADRTRLRLDGIRPGFDLHWPPGNRRKRKRSHRSKTSLANRGR